ncbi:MAG: hypothetical protein ACR2NP_11205, partial [Pirellulaceae bacterium]
MQRISIARFIVVSLGCFTPAVFVMAQDSDFTTPATVSKEASAAIKEFSLASRNVTLPVPTDLEGWKRVQTEIEEDFA